MRFPITEQSPIVHPGPPPEAADVVVIGGGVIGTCTALFLARMGRRVVLLEKGRIAGEQSSRNWGWIRQQGRDPDELPIMIQANALWRELAQQTDRDIGLRQLGITYVAKTETELAGYASWMDAVAGHGLDTEILTGPALSRRFPEVAVAGYVGAMTTPSDMKAEPWLAVPALAALAAREGVQVVENCAVRTLDMAAGRVAGVMTEAGRIRAETVVLAGGAWSSLFLARHGVRIPQLSVRASVAATAPIALSHTGALADNTLAMRPRADGGLSIAAGSAHELFVGPDAFRALPKFARQLINHPFATTLYPAAPRGYPDGWSTPRDWSADSPSPFEACRILNPAPNTRKLHKVAQDISRRFKTAQPVTVQTAWAGLIDTLPDVVPIVDHVPDLPGLILGTGMSGHGFGIGPGMGQILARLACDVAPGFDLTRFRFGRFHDGTPMRLGPAL